MYHHFPAQMRAFARAYERTTCCAVQSQFPIQSPVIGHYCLATLDHIDRYLSRLQLVELFGHMYWFGIVQTFNNTIQSFE